MNMIPAESIEAIYEVKSPQSDKTTITSHDVLFWYDNGEELGGMILNSRGHLRLASSYDNFVRYQPKTNQRVVGAVPGNGLTAIYRLDDGTLNKSPIEVLLVHADGEINPCDLSSDGFADIPAEAHNFVGYWHPSWGELPWKDEAPKEKPA
jgi:hypothetical protein